MQKLIYITNARIPTEKAHGLQIMKMCEAFASSGFDVSLAVPLRINSLKADAFEYYGVKKIFKLKKIFSLDLFWLRIIPKKFAFYLQWASFAVFALVYAFLKRGRGNIFYSRDWLVLSLLSLFGFAPLGEIHDYKGGRSWLAGFAARRLKKIIVNSEGTKRFLQADWGIPSDRILVAPNGVDADFFQPKESRQEARERLHLPQDKHIISFIGRLETAGFEKGVDDLISAFEKVAGQRKDVFFCIVGGPEELVQKYKDQASGGEAAASIFFAGQAPYRLIPLYLRAADIVLIPAPREERFAQTTSPIKVFEFLAAGKVIIASDIPGLKNYLNEKNAVFFNGRDAEGLAKKINFVLDNPDLVANLKNQAVADSLSYSWISRAKSIGDFIKR